MDQMDDMATLEKEGVTMERRTTPAALGMEVVFQENPLLNLSFEGFVDPEREAQMPPEFKERIENYKKEHPFVPGEAEKTGHFERFDYTTTVYEDGVTYPKYCNVYLPAGYDPEDKEKKYNVIYFQHGNTGDPEFFPMPGMKLMLDRLYMEQGIDPCIMVFTTYYFDVTKDVEERRRTGNVPAGDGNYPGVKANFYREITEDLIPAVESKYNTYLAGTDPESVKKARDHRLFSGYSRGCVATWYMIHNAFEYFRYFIPMSCITTAGKSIQDPPTDAEIAAYLTAPMKAHPELPFFIYALNGGENDIKNMAAQMRVLVDTGVFSFGQDPEKNNFYYAESGYFHGDMFAPQYYFNALPVMFRG